MRVIAGEFRRLRLRTLRGNDVRPTPDRLREALFDVLAPRIEDAVFIDAYAGCGSVGIEALSRGAKQVIFIERNPEAVQLIRRNLSELGVASGVAVYCERAAPRLAELQADIVFIDPPYPNKKEYAAALEALGANPPALAVAQHTSREPLPGSAGRLRRLRTLRQGDNSLTFYEPSEEQPPPQSAML